MEAPQGRSSGLLSGEARGIPEIQISLDVFLSVPSSLGKSTEQAGQLPGVNPRYISDAKVVMLGQGWAGGKWSLRKPAGRAMKVLPYAGKLHGT